MEQGLKFTPTEGKGCFRRLCCEADCKKHASKFIELDKETDKPKTDNKQQYKYYCHEHAPFWAENLNGL